VSTPRRPTAPPRERPTGVPGAAARGPDSPPPRGGRPNRGTRAATAPLPLGPALAFLRDLRSGLDTGRGPAGALLGATAGLPRDVREGLDAAVRRLAGDYDEDEWGFDEEFTESVFPLLELMYDRWWRVQADGVRNVPAHGRALLVANHAGILPWDATMMGVAMLREHPLPRYPRFLVLNWAFELPYVGSTIRKVGGTPASPFNAMRLLEQEQLVAVFPEGVKGTSKDFKDRYRLQRFGRGGFVELALRTGSPIVPVAVVGSEEIYPKIGELPLLAKAAGAPFFPVTPTFPLLGPLGAVPLPSKWRIEFCDPIEVADYGPDAAEDRALVFELSERVRDTIQQKLYENLVKRGSAFL
jgi:1-acyl-sn-glycerol-3-phosphate acyltransferase